MKLLLPNMVDVSTYTILVIMASISSIFSQDIIGCGGFIKTGVPLDLTQIKVKLLTSYGSVKYTSEPAPNGYYMIPVYEKGEYQIQIQPKAGWNFQPGNPVNVDLEACERNEDINFIFTGFEISGQVLSEGTREGPSDVEVTLTANGKDLQKTKTVDGKYTYSNVLSGQYIIKASYTGLIFSKSEVAVTVKDDVMEVKESPIIHGYSISGSISNEGQPTKGVNFIIKSVSNQKVDIKECTTGSPANYDQKGTICYVTSDESGRFKFQSVPVGKYTIVPFHRGEKTIFEVTPSQLTVEVLHTNLHIKNPFTVSGFGVNGQVKYSSKGKGVNGAVVSIDGKEVARTDSHGSYAIDGMKSGTYTVTVKAPSVYFDDMRVSILPSEPRLPLITPTSFDLCGKVSLDSTKITGLSVSIKDITNTGKQNTVTVGDGGLFCVKVKPGTYTVMPIVKSLTPALTLTPSSMKIIVSDSPISSDSVKFSQFKAVLSGEVKCLSSCGDVDVVLRTSADNSIVKKQKVTSTALSTAFVFQGIVPGEYSISAVRSSWCWVDNSKSVIVREEDVSHIILQQKGYGAIVESSNTMSIRFSKKLQGDQKKQGKAEEGQFAVTKGTNEICFPSTGKFEITPLFCHVFDRSPYIFDTYSANKPIRIHAMKYMVRLRLMSEQPVTDVTVKLRFGDDELDVKMPPSMVENGNHVSEIEQGLDVSVTQFTAVASSALVLFSQQTYMAIVKPDECPAALVEMTASKGIFVEGSVSPPIADLNIHLGDSTGKQIEVRVTDKKGNYRFGPLPDNDNYEVTAAKPGYVLAKDENNSFMFRAFKLAEVSVRVQGNDGINLAGVILSLSGNAYKSNNRTDDNGYFSFIGLSPGLYYLKAILKEYEFSPASLEVKVEEGVTEDVRVIGKRIAYSCVGEVVNLNGNPVAHAVIVKAQGIRGEDCVNTEESSQAEPSGYFRVRGLKPVCSYSLKLSVLSREDKNLVYRASPESFTVNMKAEDVNVGRFIVVESLELTTVTVFLKSHRDFLSTLKIVLAKEGSASPLQTVNPGNSKVAFFNNLPMDSVKYKVYLESSLSKALYDYETSEELFVANGTSISLNLQFTPKAKTKLEYEVKESSLLALVLVILTALLVINKDKVVNLFSKQR